MLGVLEVPMARVSFVLTVAALVAATACGGRADSGAANAGAADGGPATTNAGGAAGSPGVSGAADATSAMRAAITVRALHDGQTPPERIPVVIEVDVSQNDAAVVGATVTAGALGAAVAATPSGPGRYLVSLAGYARAYEVDIDAPGGSLHGVRLASPALHTAHVAPAVVRSAAPASVTWEPSHDPVVDYADVSVVDIDSASTTFQSSDPRDVGSLTTPGSAFPGAGSFTVTVTRSSWQPLAWPTSVGRVEIVSTVSAEAR